MGKVEIVGMSKPKLLSPWKTYSHASRAPSVYVVQRNNINDWFEFGIVRSLGGKYFPSSSAYAITGISFELDNLEEAKRRIDSALEANGYVLLSEERYEKLRLLV